MKKRIEQLLNGEFEYEAPKMALSEKRISGVVQKGGVLRGAFEIENAEQKKMKGFIYSSSPRMAYEPSDFYAISEKVVYEFDTTGMDEGEVLDGEFIICSELGEYRIPYHLEIARNLIKTSEEIIGSLDDLEKLAKEDLQKAYTIFISRGFRKMLAEKYPQWLPLYEGLTNQSRNCSAMDEFFVSIGAKKAITVSLEKTEAFFEKVTQTQQESIVILKDNWGFQRLEINADADFIQIERGAVTTDEFIGSSYRLNYLIEPDRLHMGRNYGRITVKSPFAVLSYEVTVVSAGRNETALKKREQKQRIKKLMEQYVDFRLHRLELAEWTQSSLAELEEYRNAGGAEPMLELYRAHICFASGKADEACVILTEFQGEREKAAPAEVEGYYLYLTTFYNKDREYIDYVEERLEELFGWNRENWMLQWFLLYLQEHIISHPAEKLEAIRTQYICGCRSRIMYVEAYQIIEKSPMLLKRLGEFETGLLRFICREGLLSDDIILQVGELAGRQKEYSGILYEILKQCYEKTPSEALLGSICSLLIKGNKTDAEYFIWYEKAVEADLRIAGLYEYYVISRKPDLIQPLPQMVRMYFAYNNTLSYRKKAVLYANVIRNRDNDPRTFQGYRPIIEKFMVDQLEAGHINRELALIYSTFLNQSVLTKSLAEHLAEVIFACEVRCESPNARYVVVTHRQLEEEQRAALVRNKAMVQIYTDDCQVFIEDDRGSRYSVSMTFETERLLGSRELIELCRSQAPDCPEMLLYACGMADKEHPVNEDNVDDFGRLLEIEGVKETYRAVIRQEMLDYYFDNPKAPSLYDFLRRIDMDEFAMTDKGRLLSLMVAEGMNREAFELIETYGAEKADISSLVRMCSRNVLSREFEEDAMLLAVCWHCFVNDKYDETILSYLVKFYDGPVENMKRLWGAGKKFELDTYGLEEKILMVLEFMRCGAEDTEEIFESYAKNAGKRRLLDAYVIYRAYDFFVKEITVKEPVFVYIENGYERGREQQDICLLALLRRYSQLTSLSENQMQNAQQLLEEFNYQGMQFAFYKDFDPAMLRPLQLQDKSYVEYRAHPGAAVTITWHIDTRNKEVKELSETMRNVFEGIFVKEFILFYGETVHFRIEEDYEGVKKETEEATVSWDDRNGTDSDTCYDLINRLAKALTEDDSKTAENVMQLYLEQECLAEHIFPVNE